METSGEGNENYTPGEMGHGPPSRGGANWIVLNRDENDGSLWILTGQRTADFDWSCDNLPTHNPPTTFQARETCKVQALGWLCGELFFWPRPPRTRNDSLEPAEVLKFVKLLDQYILHPQNPPKLLAHSALLRKNYHVAKPPRGGTKTAITCEGVDQTPNG